MKPEDLRKYLKEKGLRFHRKKVNGIEMWIRDDLHFPLTFYSNGPLIDEELRRLTDNLGLPPSDLGDWRKLHSS